MSAAATLLFENLWPGAGYPTFDPWPEFTWPATTGGNPPFPQPVVDGQGHGIPSRSVSYVDWRARSTRSPGQSAYQADLWAKWKNPGGAGRREVGLLVRMKDGDNFLAARIRSMAGASPELRVFLRAAGVEVQLGATVTHALLSTTKMAAGLYWRVRVEDLADGSGNSRLTVYLNPGGPTDKGTLVFDWTGDIGGLRGAHTVGVDLVDLVGTGDCWVGPLRVYDLADEWNPGGPAPAPGSGWQVEIGGTLYTLAELDALDPPVTLEEVSQGYGLGGNEARFVVRGSWSKAALLRPGREVLVLHDGAVRFRGWIEDGQLTAAPAESQSWTALDGYNAARQIELEEDDHDPVHWFNVLDPKAEEYRADRVDLPLGEALRWLFDRYTPALRRYGAAPPTGTPYVTSELAALDAIIYDLSVEGTFTAAVDTLLRFMAHRFMVWWDPSDRVWHFRDVTTLAGEAVECTAEHLRLRVKPDRSRAFTKVVWRGGRRERADDVTLTLKGGDLVPAWSKAQEDTYHKGKATRSRLRLKALASGTGVAPDGIVRMYADVAPGVLEEDDIRGWVLMVDGFGFTWLCTNNTGTRVWFSPPTLGGAPPIPAGTGISANAVHPDALPALSAQGVGRGYFLARPQTVCPAFVGALDSDLYQGGFCGKALVATVGLNGEEHVDEYVYSVVAPSLIQQQAGFCSPVVTLAEKPKPPVGLVNYLPPKGSMPDAACGVGNQNTPRQLPTVDVEINVPRSKEDVPYFEEPAGAGVFSGPAYDEWGVEQPYPVRDPDFILPAVQEAGLRKAAQHILAVKSQLPYLFEVDLATPWHVVTPERPVRALTSTWAGLGKRVVVTSAKRATGFEEAAGIKLPVLRVTWRPMDNVTVLQAGTVSAWLQLGGIDVARAFSDRRTLLKALTAIQRLEEFRKRLLEKSAARVGRGSQGSVDGCDVSVSNEQTRRVVNVEKDDQDKVANITAGAVADRLQHSLAHGVEPDLPGAPIAVPGRDGAAARQAIDGPVTRSLADPRIPFQGPAPGHEGYGWYGGQIVTDAEADGKPPREVLRAGGFVFRMRADAEGVHYGGPGVEYAAVDAQGLPAGGWTPYRRPQDLPDGVWPMKALASGSTDHQLLVRSQLLASRMLMVEDSLQRLVESGKATAAGVAPADLLDLVVAQILGPDYEVVRATLSDPGGLVFWGPRRKGGASAEAHWRVHPVAKVPVEVTPAALGAGTNGGSWSDVELAPGVLHVLLNGYIHDKQVHLGADFEPDGNQPGVGTQPFLAEPGHPFLGSAHLRTYHATQPSGWAFTVALPKGVQGVPLFWAQVAEDPGPPVGLAVLGAGLTHVFRIDYAYQASPWGAAAAGANQSFATDGTGTGDGQFRQAGGAVPPGLRRVAASIVYTPGLGTAPPGASTPVLQGAGVQVAVVEGGYLVVATDALEAAETWQRNHAALLERAGLASPFAVEAGKGLAEGLDLLASWAIDLNPPVVVFEGLDVDAPVALEAGKGLAEGLEADANFVMVLNP